MPLTAAQQTIVEAPQRFKVVVAGRRFGKTHLSIRQLAWHARLPNRTVWYVAPTYRQAKMIAWKKLRNQLTDLRWVSKINETELTLELKNNSTISLKGADNYDSLRGVGLDYLVLDEFADIDPAAWYETLRPTLSDRMGQALFIGTPKGLNWAHDLYNTHLQLPAEWASFQYTTIDGGQVTAQEVAAAAETLDLRTFRQEYCATFETFSGRVFYSFDRQHNIRAFEGTEPREIHVGIDFNIDPICAVIAVRQPYGHHVIDEIKIYGSNTDELVQEIKIRYPQRNIVCYPDPAGSARKTSAGSRTDHTILRAAGFQVCSRSVTASIRDGVNAVNSLLASSGGIRRLFIDPKCKYVIECLERQTYKEGTSIPDKTSGYDHMNDALRYMIEYLYPITQPVEPPPFKMWSHQLKKH